MNDIFEDGFSYFTRVKFGEEKINEVSKIKENLIFSNDFINFYNDEVYFPGGVIRRFLRLETPDRLDGSVIVAIDDLHRLAVVKQFRYAARIWEIGFPRGFCKREDIGGGVSP